MLALHMEIIVIMSLVVLFRPLKLFNFIMASKNVSSSPHSFAYKAYVTVYLPAGLLYESRSRQSAQTVSNTIRPNGV